jgi:methylthioribose-1-phosphate isomerase
MKINKHPYEGIWLDENQKVQVIDQRFIPFELKILELMNLDDAVFAIKEMVVRGAPLIGVTAAFGMYLAIKEGIDPQKASKKLKASRPTAVDLEKNVDKVLLAIKDSDNPLGDSLKEAMQLKEETINQCKKIGLHGLKLIEDIYDKNGKKPVNILTHCNAGWLATVDYGTATAPIYLAHNKGIPVHVWVDETRPRNQGAFLTTYELGQHGVPHTLIADNTGGHLMQHGMVDVVIVGTDRTSRNGDVANKIGTYLKALAAFDNQIPFYVAAPSSSIDFNLTDGIKNIPIETRDEKEVKYMRGLAKNKISEFLICPAETPAANYAFDVTPARLIKGLITERGICAANEEAILSLFPEFS